MSSFISPTPPKVEARRVIQLAGAFAGAAVLVGVFGDALQDFEQRNGIERGGQGSEARAIVFGEYYPKPPMIRVDRNDPAVEATGSRLAGQGSADTLLYTGNRSMMREHKLGPSSTTNCSNRALWL
jgi:hypothetical protein